MKAFYCTQRFYDACHRETFGANQTDTKISGVKGNLFVGIPIVVNNTIPDPPGFLAVREDGMILYPKIKLEGSEG